MGVRMRLGRIGIAFALALWSATGSAQGFDNQSVVALHRAGLGDTTIIAKVKSLTCGYDVSTDALIALKQAGLSDAVIAAMVGQCSASARAQGIMTDSPDPFVAHAPGIYVLQTGATKPQLHLIRPSKASGVKVTGNGSILLPYVRKLVIPDDRSRTAIDTRRPTFYFYFRAGDANVSDFGTPNSIAAQSPDEFSLVHFAIRKAQREVGIGKMSVLVHRRGVDTRDAVRFDSTEIGESAFKVEPARDLEPGEYAFVLTGAKGSARVYDFTIS